MDLHEFNQDLLTFLQQSPTPFHATAHLAARLERAGYQALQEADAWQLEAGGRYFATRNDSSLIAFRLGEQAPVETGIRMLGAHTDSPCLKLKPHPELGQQGYFQLGVEVYGGALLNPWFDRDLSLAGRVHYRNADGAIRAALVDFLEPIASIPSLAIHLDRDANESHPINAQKHLAPILWQLDAEEQPDFRGHLLELLRAQQPDAEAVLDFELSFYDHQAPALLGVRQDFIASARLDNLLSCYTGLQALLTAHGEQSCLLVCNDHEEVGSASHCGADGPFLQSILERMCGSREDTVRAVDRSMLISADNAHGIHPNYADKHDDKHGPLLNGGPVIKINANQRYATSSETSAVFRHIAEQLAIPVQSFVVRSDMACGSTIGPITASGVGVRTVDIGAPQFAMHSIRELAGAKDAHYLYQIVREFFGRAELGLG